MIGVPIRRALALVPVLALTVSACSDIVGPQPQGPSLAVGHIDPFTGTTLATIATNTTDWTYCGFDASIAATRASFPVSPSCGASFAPPPVWGAPLTGSTWISSDANSHQDGAPGADNRGAYLFRTTFVGLPSGALNPKMNITVRADNSVLVYLNGNFVGAHSPIEDNDSYWDGSNNLLLSETSGFVAAPGVNVLEVVLINVNEDCELRVTCSEPMALSLIAEVKYETALQGCSHGFYKNHTGPAAWVGYTTASLLQGPFTPLNSAISGNNFGQALNYSGGSGVLGAQRTLMRNAVAALLNAANTNVNYPLTTAQVIAQVNAALATNNRNAILAFEQVLDGYNNAGCPINGK
jgi:hypothetical protein